MWVDATGWGGLVVMLLMAAVTLLTRWGGLLIMGFIPLSPLVRRFISAMSGSVLIAVLAPLAMQGDAGARVALGVTALMMLLFKKPLPAIAAGLLAAAWIRHALV